jgi:mannose-6-phosphate isomerase-like protein (cupin superfamily)
MQKEVPSMTEVRHATFTHVPAGAGEMLWVLGDQVTFKTDGERDGLTVFVATIPPGGGPPPHVHEHQEEAHFVLEGTFSFLNGDAWVEATTGSFLLISRGVVHAFRNTGSAPGRLLVTNNLPGAHERWFRHVGAPITDLATFQPPTGEPDMADVLSSAAQADIHFLPTDAAGAASPDVSSKHT